MFNKENLQKQGLDTLFWHAVSALKRVYTTTEDPYVMKQLEIAEKCLTEMHDRVAEPTEK